MNGETLEGSCQKIVVDILDIVLYRAAEWKYCFRCLSLEAELMERENRKEFDIYFVIHYLDLLTIFLRIDITKYFQFVDMILKRNAQNRLLHFSAENLDNSAALRGSASPHCSWPRNLSLDISIVFGCWTLAAPATAR